jgi:hypothetical protein
MKRPKYKQLYLDEKAKVEWIFKVMPEAKSIYEEHCEIVKQHTIELEKTFLFGIVSKEEIIRREVML